jgi:hypothetical protein
MAELHIVTSREGPLDPGPLFSFSSEYASLANQLPPEFEGPSILAYIDTDTPGVVSVGGLQRLLEEKKHAKEKLSYADICHMAEVWPASFGY